MPRIAARHGMVFFGLALQRLENLDKNGFSLRAVAALTTERMGLAIRPCLPITLPMSSGPTLSSMMVDSGLSTVFT